MVEEYGTGLLRSKCTQIVQPLKEVMLNACIIRKGGKGMTPKTTGEHIFFLVAVIIIGLVGMWVMFGSGILELMR